MASIKAKVTSVEEFKIKCSENYNLILSIANGILSDTERMFAEAQVDLEKVTRQELRARILREDSENIRKSYQEQQQMAERELERWEDEIEYIYNHPISVTTTDDDGNQTTEKQIDSDALRLAEREKDNANSQLGYTKNKCYEADRVFFQAQSCELHFKGLKTAIEQTCLYLQGDIYEVKKYIRFIEEEADYNIHSVQSVINSFQNYLASKSIFMPDGSFYEEFALSDIRSGLGERGFYSEDGHILYVNSAHDIVLGDVEYYNDSIKDETRLSTEKYEGTSGENIEKTIQEYENSERFTENLKFAGIDGDVETQNEMKAYMKKVFDSSSLSMRIKPETLSKILQSGKFANMFETGMTSGVKSEEARKELSKLFYGTSDGTPNKGYEKYGYMDTKGMPKENNTFAMGSLYGKVIIMFKNNVKATFTCGDSLDHFGNDANSCRPNLITNPGLSSMSKFQLKKFADAIKNGETIPSDADGFATFLSDTTDIGGYKTPQYLEAQLHGEITISDIERIVLAESIQVDDACMANLQALRAGGVKICRMPPPNQWANTYKFLDQKFEVRDFDFDE